MAGNKFRMTNEFRIFLAWVELVETNEAQALIPISPVHFDRLNELDMR